MFTAKVVRTALRRHGVPTALATAALGGWLALALTYGRAAPAWCRAATSWSGVQATLRLTLALIPPPVLAVDWTLMVAAMTPLFLLRPLRHVRDRSFADRRARAVALFVGGYALVWLMAGLALVPLILVAGAVFRDSMRLAVAGGLVALIWQVSPAKQRCLNGCHRRPPLAAFGLAADRDAIKFGLTHGAWCLGACWAAVLAALLVPGLHLLAMALASAFLSTERLERPALPAWRWRGPGQAARIGWALARFAADRLTGPRDLTRQPS